MDAEEFEFSRPERSLKNSNIVDYVYTEPVVIERSPPIHVTLKGMINATNLPVWIGTYMGWSVVPEHSVLLFYHRAGRHHHCEFCRRTCECAVSRSEHFGEAAV